MSRRHRHRVGIRHRRAWYFLWIFCACGYRWRCPTVRRAAESALRRTESPARHAAEPPGQRVTRLPGQRGTASSRQQSAGLPGQRAGLSNSGPRRRPVSARSGPHGNSSSGTGRFDRASQPIPAQVSRAARA